MRKTTAILAALTAAVLVAGAAWGQNTPRPKSQKELDGLKTIDAAPSVDLKLQKIDDFLAAFADSDYKPILLDNAVGLAANKNDYPLTMAWGQRDLDANPNSYIALLSLATVTVSNTKEFDLDKDQKLNQAEKWANGALEALKTASKPFYIQDEKWPDAKKGYEASCHQTLGLIALARKKFDVAAAEFQKAFDILPEPAYMVRVGESDVKAGKLDEAIAAFDKVLAMPDLNAVVKQVTEREKANAVKRKSISAPAAAQPAPPPAAAPAPADTPPTPANK
jgi:tetratricopeptide (TPR) repeat protein